MWATCQIFHLFYKSQRKSQRISRYVEIQIDADTSIKGSTGGYTLFHKDDLMLLYEMYGDREE